MRPAELLQLRLGAARLQEAVGELEAAVRSYISAQRRFAVAVALCIWLLIAVAVAVAP